MSMRKICQNCGSQLKRNKLSCDDCGHWNLGTASGMNDGTELLSQAKAIEAKERYKTSIIDELLGGGLVHTSVGLLGGPPGAGKSTISLQLISEICRLSDREGLYIATEQPNSEVRLLGERLRIPNLHQIRMMNLLQDTGGADMDEAIERYKPCAIVLDSLVGLVGTEMNVAVEVAKSLKQSASKYNTPVIIIDHVNKDRDFAGLMALQHEVDWLMLITPLPDGRRILEIPEKNRFGPTPAEKMFHMPEDGPGLVAWTDEDQAELDAEDEEDDE
jgi:DNA repair protein RadA/Sms